MINKLEGCPEPQTLVDYMLGKLSTNELETCQEHISDCDPCVETIRGLKIEGDTLTDLTREAWQAAQTGEPEDSGVVEGLIARMQQLPLNSSAITYTSDESLRNKSAEVRALLGAAKQDNEIGCLADYRILDILGAGSTGVVYHAVDERLNRPVALKILRPSLGEAARERFTAEAMATAAINHPNVITIYEVGSAGPLAYIAMQWLPGQTLEAMLEDKETLDAEEVNQLGIQLAKGLQAAHACGLIHRDIKPANIWMPDNEHPRILDFGLVRITDENPQLTCTGMIAGTPCYMSPEQSRGQQLDGRSDLFSLGCVLYRSLTGRLPFHSDNALSTLQAIQRDQPTSPRELDPSIPADLSDLVMCLLEKSPGRRPADAKTVASALQSDRSEWPFNVPAPIIREKPRHAGHAGYSWWKLSAALIAGLVLGALGFMYGPQITRVVTNQGEIVIDSKVDDVQIEVLQGGEQVRIIDLKTEQSLDIKAGEYEFRPVGSENGITISPSQLTMTRGGREIVAVTITGGTATNTGETSDPTGNFNAGSNGLNNNVTAFNSLPLNSFSGLNATGPAPYTLGSGDTLGVFIDGVLGEYDSNPPTHIPPPESGLPPSLGYPVMINENGSISLPLIPPLSLNGMTVDEARNAIDTAYKEGDDAILRESARVLVCLMRPRNYVPPAAINRTANPLSSGLNLRGSDLSSAMSNFSGGDSALETPDLSSANLNSAASGDNATFSGGTGNALNSASASTLNSDSGTPLNSGTGNRAGGNDQGWNITESTGSVSQPNFLAADINLQSSQLPDLSDPAAPLLNTREYEPVYNGRNFEQWMTVARTEYDWTQLMPAALGLDALSNESNRDEVDEVLLSITRRPVGRQNLNFNDFHSVLRNRFRELPIERQVDLMVRELEEGNDKSRGNVRSLMPSNWGYVVDRESESDPAVGRLIDALCRFAESADEEGVTFVNAFLRHLHRGLDLARHPAAVEHFQQQFIKADPQSGFGWLDEILIQIAPDSPGLQNKIREDIANYHERYSGMAGGPSIGPGGGASGRGGPPGSGNLMGAGGGTGGMAGASDELFPREEIEAILMLDDEDLAGMLPAVLSAWVPGSGNADTELKVIVGRNVENDHLVMSLLEQVDQLALPHLEQLERIQNSYSDLLEKRRVSTPRRGEVTSRLDAIIANLKQD